MLPASISRIEINPATICLLRLTRPQAYLALCSVYEDLDNLVVVLPVLGRSSPARPARADDHHSSPLPDSRPGCDAKSSAFASSSSVAWSLSTKPPSQGFLQQAAQKAADRLERMSRYLREKQREIQAGHGGRLYRLETGKTGGYAVFASPCLLHSW
jgi:hypothetical protein